MIVRYGYAVSLDDLRQALDDLDEPSLHEGTVQLSERLAIMLPDGDVGAVDDPQFVDWLVAHGEAAPFGFHQETRLDARVRDATRLTARGEVLVTGFDPAAILGEIEQVLSPREHLAANLIDVIAYPAGGHFVPHMDTPRTPEMVGTLVVGLPIAHDGGAFTIADRDTTHVIDWSGEPDRSKLRWVALFSDAEHAVARIRSGTRVTLVYSLAGTGEPRADTTWTHRLAAVEAAARRAAPGTFLVGCARHVIGLDGPQPQRIGRLRGVDREVADALVRAGFDVTVRMCIAARREDYDLDEVLRDTFRALDPSLVRLARPVSDEVVRDMLACITFEEPYGPDGGGYTDLDDASSLAPYTVGPVVEPPTWVMRRNAAVTFLRDADHAPDGFIGNGADSSYLYKLAALEVTSPYRD